MWNNYVIVTSILSQILLLVSADLSQYHLIPSEKETAAGFVVEHMLLTLNILKGKLEGARWDYASNITDHNLKMQNQAEKEMAKFRKDTYEILRSYYDDQTFFNEDLKRKIFLLLKIGYAILPESKYTELRALINDMETHYTTVKVCPYVEKWKSNSREVEVSNCTLALEPDINNIFRSSEDPNELMHYWTQWYNRVGPPIKDKFEKYVHLVNEAAQLNGFASQAEAWLSDYEDSTFEQQCENILMQIRPIYEQLHAYVRYSLRKKYGRREVSKRGPIPMHLLGNIWAVKWHEIAAKTVPFPDKPTLDVTDEMIKQKYTPVKMFEMGDEFFQSLNMTKLPKSFWEKSILEKPDDGREMVCHASAWEFFAKDDVRIKQCTRVSMDQLFTVHHELGHIQYYLQFKDQPAIYKEGANPGFHEAVGDTIALSVSSPKHLERVGLIDHYDDDYESKINQLYFQAMSKIVILPYAFSLDKYRWNVFRREILPKEFNCRYWEMRDVFSGVEPPEVRTEDNMDALAKYHISADIEYLRYFVSNILQFQFHMAACELAGEYVRGNPDKPLSNCDIYENLKAGNAFKKMLKMGTSKPWPDAMEVMTGQRAMDATAILEYFAPLYEFLKERNKENGEYIGWERSNKYQCNHPAPLLFS